MSKGKKIVIVIAAVLLFLVVLFALSAILFEKRISDAVNQKVSALLSVPMYYDNSNLSFIRAFPSATLEYENLLIESIPLNGANDTLLFASSFKIKMNLFSLLGGHIIINKLSIDRARIFLFSNAQSKNNYDVFESDETKEEDDFELNLRSFEFEDLYLSYQNLQNQVSTEWTQSNGELKGNFSKQIQDLAFNAQLNVHYLDANGLRYIENKNTQLDLNLSHNRDSSLIRFNESVFQLSGLRLKISGSIREQKRAQEYDLDLSSDRADLKALLSVLPFLSQQKLEKFESSGLIDFKAKVMGLQNEKSSPGIEVHFSGSDMRIKPKGGKALEQIQFNGYYGNGKSKGSSKERVSVENFSANLSGQKMEGSFSLEQFSNPLINARLKLKGDLKDIGFFILPDTVENARGEIQINASVSGRVSLPASLKGSGSIAVNNASFQLKNNPLEYEQCQLNGNFNAHRFQINDLQMKFGSSDVSARAQIENLWAYLFKENETLHLSGQVSSSSFRLDDILPEEKTNTADTSSSLFELSKNLHMDVSIAMEDFAFRVFKATQLKGDLKMSQQVLSTENVSFNTVEGGVLLNSSIDAREKDSLTIMYHATTSGLNVSKLFEEMGNFGQEVITSKNIKGHVSSEIDFYSRWHKNLSCNMNSIVCRTQFTIVNGELNNFAPILPLSRYVRGADFGQIRFSTLTNTIEVKNRVIYIPSMEIKSSALDITASGTHTFDNMVDYKIRLYLSDLLGRKVKQMNTEFGTIESDNTGRSSLHIVMTGPINDPKFKWDRKAVREKIEQSVKEGTKNFRDLIRKEIGKYKSDSLPETPKETQKEKKQELQLDFD